VGVHGGHMQPVELPPIVAGVADLPYDSAIAAVDDPNDVVHDVRHKQVPLFRVCREADGPNGSTVECLVGYKEFLHELALLRKHLDSVAAAIADVDEPINRDLDAVDRFCELFGRRT